MGRQWCTTRVRRLTAVSCLPPQAILKELQEKRLEHTRATVVAQEQLKQVMNQLEAMQTLNAKLAGRGSDASAPSSAKRRRQHDLESMKVRCTPFVRLIGRIGS